METYSAGEDVSLSEKYYTDTKATVLEVPRFGWKVTSVEDGIATIEYQRPNWKLLMTIICEVTYLQRES